MTMDSSTSETTKMDLTTCSICLETFNTPKCFPCLHSFCEGCIKTYITTTFEQTNGGVSCPVCRMYVPKPEDISIEDWSSKIPTHHFLVSLINMNESKTGRSHCKACARENETESASSWCINCAESLCKSCESSHRRNKFTSNHKLINIGSSELPIYNAEILCKEHPEEKVKAYCIDHSVACCMTCVSLKHRKCESVESIDDVAKQKKTSEETESFSEALNDFKRALEKLVQCKSENLQTFDSDIQNIKSEVNTIFTMLSEHLSRLQTETLEGISKIEKEVRSELEDKPVVFKCKILAIKNDLDLFQITKKYASPAQFVQSMEMLMDQRSVIEQYVKEESQKLEEIRVKFHANEQLIGIKDDIQAFGRMKIQRTWKDVTQPFDETNKEMDSPLPDHQLDHGLPFEVTGIAILRTGQILLSHNNNNTIELRDHQGSSVLSSLSLPGRPWGIKMTSDTEGAVAVRDCGLIIFSVENNQITKIDEIEVNVTYDFVYHESKYFVGCGRNIAVYDSSYHKVRDLSTTNNVGYMAVRDDTSLLYTSSGLLGPELHCITIDGTPVFTCSQDRLQFHWGKD